MLLNCGAGEDSWESFGLQKRSNQSILKEISPKYSLEGLMLKLKLQYFGHLMQRTDSLEKTLMLGKIEGRRRRRWQRMRWLDGFIDSMDMGFGGPRELVMDLRSGVLCFMGSQRVGHKWAIELNWTELLYNIVLILPYIFLYGPTLTSKHDCWKNHSFDWMDLCWQNNNVSAF